MMTPFLLREGRLFCFNNLRNKDGPFHALVSDPAKAHRAESATWWNDDKLTPWFTSLLTLFGHSQRRESAPQFSPDGRWIAYDSTESGRTEIYVRPFPGLGGKWQISTEGGAEPVWNPKGKELFYRNRNKMMVNTEGVFSAGEPKCPACDRRDKGHPAEDVT